MNHARCAHSDEEASSVVLHVSWDMNEKEKDDEEASDTAAAKETGQVSKEDVEIRRLIEEIRSTPKEEKQRLKEVSKCFKKCIRDIQRILEDFKGVKNIPRIKSAKKIVLITMMKSEKQEIITSRKGIANVFGNSANNFSTTMNKKKLNKKSVRMKMRAASMCRTTTPMRWWESQRSRQKSCELQSTKSKRQIPRQQRNRSRRHQSMRRWDERNGETNLQQNHKAEWVHAGGMEECENKSDVQKRRCWKLPPDLLIASVVQTVHDNTVQQILSTTRPTTSGRSSGIQKLIPDNRPSCDVQKDWAEIPRVENQNVDSDNRFHQGIRLHHTQINLERPQILRYRTRLHQPPEEAIQRPESISTDWRRMRHVRDQEKTK